MAARITDAIVIKAHGETAGSATAKQLPSVPGVKWAKIKAAIDNAGNAFIGTSSAVTKMAGTDTTTAGWPLDSGQETDWLPVKSGNLSQFWIICDNAGDDISWVCAS